LFEAPGGTHGLYAALNDNDLLADMNRRGIRFVHVYGVDNVLVKVADPVFSGLCIQNHVEIGVKVAKRFHPREPINPLYTNKINNKKCILDQSIASKYSSYLHKKPPANYGDIGYYFFSLTTLEDICKRETKSSDNYNKLSHHGTFIDENGLKRRQMCFKYEKFLTDQFSGDFKTIEVNRKLEYSPLKYMVKSEHYTKLYCKDDLMNLHYNWLLNAGARFHYPGGKLNNEIKSIYGRNDQSHVDDLPVICEVSPLVSYNGENLAEYVRGHSFEPPLVLDLDLATNQVTFNGMDFTSYKKSYPTQFF
jgi:UDP-N-acetylglucosamine/UDP-N-acetylgalactosamine diphosphorylase